MKKQTKAALGTAIGFILFSALIYLGITFLYQQSDVSLWKFGTRMSFIFALFCYILFTPLIYMILKDEL